MHGHTHHTHIQTQTHSTSQCNFSAVFYVNMAVKQGKINLEYTEFQINNRHNFINFINKKWA